MTAPARYRRRPTEVRAVQLRWSTWNHICEFLGDTISEANPGRYIEESEASDTCGEAGPQYIAVDVTTVHGETATVRHGDWIIAEATPGRYYPCKPDIFAATYEPAK